MKAFFISKKHHKIWNFNGLDKLFLSLFCLGRVSGDFKKDETREIT